MQIPIFKPQTEWLPPTDFPDLGKYDEIAVDLETKDHLHIIRPKDNYKGYKI